MHTFVQFKSAAKVQKKIDIRKRTRVFLVFYARIATFPNVYIVNCSG
jgi:hypothetical protein